MDRLDPTAVLTVGETAAADRAAVAAGTPLATLMARAGRATADAVRARWTARPVLVLCGPGDNGGDGYVAAAELARAGWSVRLAALGPPRGEAAREAAAGWSGPVLALEEAAAALGEAGLVVDALFGAGLSRPPPAAVVDLLRAAQDSAAFLVAVDLPSGLQGDVGRPLGFAPRADLTVAFGARKIAHVLEPGRGLCGEFVIADIGLPATPARVHVNGPHLWAGRWPWPAAEAHKMTRGRLVVVSGGVAHTGAARMSARAGLRVGAGLVTLLASRAALLVVAAASEAVMVRGFATADELGALADEAQAAVIGPAAGVGPATAEHLGALAATGAALVVDADALTSFRDRPADLFALLDARDVLTPHPGEFERVFPGLLADAPERLTAARRAAERAGAVVVLKGFDTVVAHPDGRAAVNVNGTPWLATAGSGDVLTGLVGGLLAQGMESFDAACAAVWVHGEAARGFGPGLIAEDLPDLVPRVLADLHAQR